MALRLYDTLSRAKVDFAPADPKRVTMYVCGPTVYSRAHIGNTRPAVVFDVLARLLRHTYGDEHVVYARNVTDVDDKIMAAAAAEGCSIETIAQRFEAYYLADMGALGVAPPTHAPHATDYIAEMVAMIGELVARGHAYGAQGHVLFDTGAAPDYGRLSRRALDEMIAGARVEVAPYKRSPADFVLWKPSTTAQVGWDSPWGCGRPGWHIECSAMIRSVLGETIDIHGGGLDLIFPHHENELAQSSCANAAPLAKVWMHNGFLSVGGDKMSKSAGKIATVDTLLADGWHPEVLRLALMSAHYRQPLEWTNELLERSRNTLDNWYKLLSTDNDFRQHPSHLPADIINALYDDLNTPQALAAVSQCYSKAEEYRAIALQAYVEDELRQASKFKSDFRYWLKQLRSGARMLGLLHSSPKAWFQRDHDPWYVEAKLHVRGLARAKRDFEKSDDVRDRLLAQGILIEDGPVGTTWRRA